MAVKKVKAWAVVRTGTSRLAHSCGDGELQVYPTKKRAAFNYDRFRPPRYEYVPCTITITPTKPRAGRKGRRSKA